MKTYIVTKIESNELNGVIEYVTNFIHEIIDFVESLPIEPRYEYQRYIGEISYKLYIWENGYEVNNYDISFKFKENIESFIKNLEN